MALQADNSSQSRPALTATQMRAITVLMTAKDQTGAAAAVGISERTLRRWLRDERFRAALAAAEHEALDAATRALTSLAVQAVAVLAALMADEAITPSVRLRASAEVLTNVLRLREVVAIEERLTALETRLERAGTRTGVWP